MIVSLILAVSENGVIGKENDLPWNVPADMRYFMRTTLEHTIIMGRKTMESLGKPLKRRRNLVVTRNPAYAMEGAEIFNSIEGALEAAKEDGEVFVIGGGMIYKKVIENGQADRIYRTLIHGSFEGDTHFEMPNEEGWKLISSEPHPADEKNPFAYTFEVFEKKT